eukprot:CAMPEP_0117762084 /NCGR_PEP_ID=MMETSP0947-20121206/17697_1 /TAXON_ID=44440 /ORGANISM="Chattonella subsalsa, Strain CCMP2191" /LENGTH=194 /DNA_ID=CAMNT_0005583263 /DNA_START=84 /DNA_END=665 /DNA_ORIENTATION=+
MAGAAAIGAVAGLCISGPIVAVAAGGAAAYATTREDKVGEVARSTGKAVGEAAKGIKRFNEEHKITEKAITTTKKAVCKAQDVNREHQIGQKTKVIVETIGEGSKRAWESARNFEQEHKIGENIQKTATVVCDGTVHLWKETCKFEQEHQIGRKIGSAIANIGNALSGKKGCGNDFEPQDTLTPRFPTTEEQEW